MKNPKDRIIIATVLLVFLFLFASIIISSASEVNTSARASALYEPLTDTFLCSKNKNVRLPMASTTKIMTALVAIENYPLDAEVKIADEACGIEGSSLYLRAGERLTMRELLYGLMLRSANDAAAAIAYEVAGGVSGFADMMNEKAQKLGLTDTHFTNPHGLDDDEHYTTAGELAIIASEALKNPTFKEIVSTYKKTISGPDGTKRLVVNHNKLLNMYDGAIGVKTGFTKKSGRCLVGATERGGLTLISVTIDAPDDWNDHIRMFDYGYSLMEMRSIAKAGEFSYDIPVVNGKEAVLKVSNKDGLQAVMMKSDTQIKAYVSLPKYIVSDVNAGDEIGKVVFKKDGEYFGEISLIAENSINIEEKKGLFPFFK
jgi:D-alanyl-D-alanine carboxypeptidase